jgi:tetratricopeptide (TPR) repeat protein
MLLAVGLEAGAARLGERWPGTLRSLRLFVTTLVVLLLGGQLLLQQSRLRDWRSERALYEASVERDPENPHALYSLGHLEALEGHWAKAKPLLAASYQRDPASWRTINSLCFVELRAGEASLAVELCRAAVEANPRNRRGWENLAGANARLGRWEDCAKASAQGIELAPNDRQASLHYLRALCLAKQGLRAEAQAELGVALGLDPNHEGADQVRRALEP